jgi:antitoxin component YwqK of YwqJK toxin-antitoxin module
MQPLFGFLVIAVVTMITPACRSGAASEPKVEETRWGNGNLRTHAVYYLDASGKRVLHGIQTEGFENGKVRLSLEYVDGIRQGVLTEWFPDGQKAREGKWDNGQQSGLWTAWQPTGQKEWEATYKDGHIIGKKVSWTSGTIVMEETYSDQGVLTEVVKYHRNGKRAMQGSYLVGKKNGTWTYWDKSGAIEAEGEWKDDAPWSGMVAIPVAGDAGSVGGLTKFSKYKDGELVNE